MSVRALIIAQHVVNRVIFVTSIQKDTSSPYSVPLTTDVGIAEAIPLGPDRTGIDLLWIVGSVCAPIVLILLAVLVIIFTR